MAEIRLMRAALVALLTPRLRRASRRGELGYTTEFVVVTAALVAAAIVVAGIIIVKTTSQANSIQTH